jgi:hypothetical protein
VSAKGVGKIHVLYIFYLTAKEGEGLMFKNLKNSELISKIKDLVREEKRITLDILNHLQEIDDRKLYAERGFSSLFLFCMSELGYSESATNRRISAMRLMRTLPEIKVKIEEGTVNLSTLCQLQTFIRREEKLEDKKFSTSEKKELLKAIEKKSQKECEKEFAKISPENTKIKESERAVTEALTEIKFMASDELMDKFKALKNYLSHKNINTYRELFEELTSIALKKFEVQKPKRIGDGKKTIPTAAAAADYYPQVC